MLMDRSVITLTGILLVLMSAAGAVEEPVLGQEDADTKIVLYSEFQDPFTSEFRDETLPEIKIDYIETGKVKIVWKDRYLESIHELGKPGAYAMECVYRIEGQDHFWSISEEVNHRLYQDSESLTPEQVNGVVSEISSDISEDELDECTEKEEVRNEVEDDNQEAEELGINGVPTFRIEDRKLVGAQPYSQFREFIESESVEEQDEVEDVDKPRNQEEEETDVDKDAEHLRDRIKDENSNVTALKERLEEQEKEIEELEEQQNMIIDILGQIMNILGL